MIDSEASKKSILSHNQVSMEIYSRRGVISCRCMLSPQSLKIVKKDSLFFYPLKPVLLWTSKSLYDPSFSWLSRIGLLDYTAEAQLIVAAIPRAFGSRLLQRASGRIWPQILWLKMMKRSFLQYERSSLNLRPNVFTAKCRPVGFALLHLKRMLWQGVYSHRQGYKSEPCMRNSTKTLLPQCVHPKCSV